MTIADIEALMDLGFPDWRNFTRLISIDARAITMVMPCRPDMLRAGGTISGPALMALSDTAAYLCTLAFAGPVVTSATSSLSIHFLSRPAPVDTTAVATLLRLGRRTSVTAVELFNSEQLVAHATVTYALPAAPGPAPSSGPT